MFDRLFKRPEAAVPTPSKLNCLSAGPVEFVFALVQGTTPDDTAEQLGIAAAVAQRGGWMVQDLLCNLAVFVRGTLPTAEPLQLERAALVEKLLQAMGAKVRVAHGAEAAHFGNMGGSARVTYGVLLPSFMKVMQALDEVPPGRSRALDTAP
ncbi:MAG TPA: hypothetical protein VI279_13095 [Rhodocyclaceae bacterium]